MDYGPDLRLSERGMIGYLKRVVNFDTHFLLLVGSVRTERLSFGGWRRWRGFESSYLGMDLVEGWASSALTYCLSEMV